MRRKKASSFRIGVFISSLAVVASVLTVGCRLQFPDKINIYKGEQLRIGSSLPYSLSMPASFGGVLSDDGSITNDLYSNDKYIKADDLGNYSASVKLFGILPVRNVDVSVNDTKTLLPGGDTIGIKMFTDGLLCVGTSDILDNKGNILNLASSCDIRTGDIVLEVNEKKIKTTEELARIVANSDGNPLNIVIKRNDETISKTVNPVLTPDGYKMGLWMRDSTAGIGTLSFIEQEENNFGALGHPICDTDTGVLLPVSDGNITKADIFSIKKGEQGVPGELKGSFNKTAEDVGTIEKNTSCGIYGSIDEENFKTSSSPLPVASKNSIKKGKAQIISTIDESGKQTFDVEIQRILRGGSEHKNMVIKVTDPYLLEKTGGIVQGMSGSPIIQDGKIVGAVTHVFVNDPTRGYGIFIENMLTEVE